ncbi:MAG: hypothetical protein Q8876_08660 [Bacillota bacterium]|nr:hypothetical protein [Bacillota bacterium]
MKCKIADLIVLIEPKYNRLCEHIKPYVIQTDENTDINIEINEETINTICKDPLWTIEDAEILVSSREFYRALTLFDGFMLHSSALAYKGGAYLFSAEPGVGKSTHTSLWQKYLGDDNVTIINDDKPAIRAQNGEVFAYGTPWSGSSDLHTNVKVPLKAIVFIERSEDNWVKKINQSIALPLLIEQTTRHLNQKEMERLLQTINTVVSQIPIYKMGCNIGEDAVKTALKNLVENVDSTMI